MSALVPRPGAALPLRALLPFLLYSLARDVDAAVGVLLHSTLDLPDFVRRAISLLNPADLARHALISVVIGGAVLGVLAFFRSLASPVRFLDALSATASTFVVLLLPPLLTSMALVAP